MSRLAPLRRHRNEDDHDWAGRCMQAYDAEDERRRVQRLDDIDDGLRAEAERETRAFESMDRDRLAALGAAYRVRR